MIRSHALLSVSQDSSLGRLAMPHNTIRTVKHTADKQMPGFFIGCKQAYFCRLRRNAKIRNLRDSYKRKEIINTKIRPGVDCLVEKKVQRVKLLVCIKQRTLK